MASAVIASMAFALACGGTRAARTTVHPTELSPERPVVASDGALNGGSAVAVGAEPEPSRLPITAMSGRTARIILALLPGMRPPVRVYRGTAGGSVAASDWSGWCRGYVDDIATFELKLEQPMPRLRIVVSSQADTTLVMQLADGSYRCSDDEGGYPNPLLEGELPAGRHRVWVGTYSASDAGASYAIGFTDDPSIDAATVVGLADRAPFVRM